MCVTNRIFVLVLEELCNKAFEKKKQTKPMKKLNMGPPKTRLLLIGLVVVSVFLTLLCNVSVECYNLSPKPNAIIRDPQLPAVMPKHEASYFGFTLSLRKLG